ncbi:alpha/beta hydrolase fold-domain-containing protein [Dichotomopilus funicola]|uniref:Alpha/beta hydrolase fold-domain-containing protein n=1 Tax=Dichotomopilus funicola TaxID=1934379 RepID=A0AAN6VAI4_9PEZI|nr:alpha/beta hydrolase fold-domain-containing protein [Dichotomopilus funicola]
MSTPEPTPAPAPAAGSNNTITTPKPKDPHPLLELLPKLPLILRTTILHILRLSEQSKYLDLRTELIIAVLRAFVSPSVPRSISETQRLTSKVPSLKGRIWVSTYACPAPPPGETGLQDAISAAIDGLRDPRVPVPVYDMPQPVSVEAEWTGYRANATAESRLPEGLSQQALYGEMMKEVKTPLTVLYFHGGAYYLLDPKTHRATTKKLAKLTGGRVYSVRYRLAPQNPFPAALMDALTSYLALLYPPEGAFHEPVPAGNIVFAGDSAGGNLALALLQLLMFLNSDSQKKNNNTNNNTITWHNLPRTLPLPAGVAVNSPWLDITHSSPSSTTNATFDYLPTLPQQLAAETKRPACAAWPAHPPRKHVFAADSLLGHPLVTLVLARSWRGAPPVYMCSGWELLADEDRFVAHKMWREGVKVVFEEFEAMPHCFGLVFPRLREAGRCLEGWAGFMKGVVEEGNGKGSSDNNDEAGVESRFVTVKARTLEEVGNEMEGLWKEGEEVVEERVWRKVRERGVAEEGLAKL